MMAHRLDQQRVNGEKPTLHLFNGGQGVSLGPSPNSGQATTVLQSHEAGAPVPVGVRCFAGSEANARTFGDTARNCLALARLVLPCGGRLAAIPYIRPHRQSGGHGSSHDNQALFGRLPAQAQHPARTLKWEGQREPRRL
jgi:hypothetical protein